MHVCAYVRYKNTCDLSIYLSTYLPTYLSIYLSIYLYIYIYIYMYIYIYIIYIYMHINDVLFKECSFFTMYLGRHMNPYES